MKHLARQALEFERPTARPSSARPGRQTFLDHFEPEEDVTIADVCG
jgi:hypothetical protein